MSESEFAAGVNKFISDHGVTPANAVAWLNDLSAHYQSLANGSGGDGGQVLNPPHVQDAAPNPVATASGNGAQQANVLTGGVKTA